MWITNQYLFLWESDFLEIRKSGFTAEYEIKVSRSDFLVDKKKEDKFRILEVGSRLQERWEYVRNPDGGYKRDASGKTVRKSLPPKELKERRPNYFSYVVPEGLITAEEVPSYAGLYYAKTFTNFDGQTLHSIQQVKSPRRIHSGKYDLWKELAAKWFYGGYINKLRVEE